MSLNERLVAKEQSSLSKALMQSRDECKEQERYDRCLTLKDVKHKVQVEKPWQVVDNDTTISQSAYCNNQAMRVLLREMLKY